MLDFSSGQQQNVLGYGIFGSVGKMEPERGYRFKERGMMFYFLLFFFGLSFATTVNSSVIYILYLIAHSPIFCY